MKLPTYQNISILEAFFYEGNERYKMAILPIKIWPHPVLETKSQDVDIFDENLKKLVSDMFETMDTKKGIGLAANQVGVAKRVCIMKVPFDPPEKDQSAPIPWWHDKKLVFINPKITKKSGSSKESEGCLSFPDIYETIDRSKDIMVEAQDENGKIFQVEATGLFSICLQHEIDHLNGIVFTSRMSRLKASLVKKRLLQHGNKNEESEKGSY